MPDTASYKYKIFCIIIKEQKGFFVCEKKLGLIAIALPEIMKKVYKF